MEHLATTDITVPPDRQRRDTGDLTGLTASVRRVGVINPVVVDAAGTLVAGHRRLLAATAAGLTTVPVVRRDGLTIVDARRIELDENIWRKGLEPLEEATAITELHQLMLDTHGQRRSGRPGAEDGPDGPPGWSLLQTAEMLGRHRSFVSMALEVTRLAAEMPGLAKAASIKSAYTMGLDRFQVLIAEEMVRRRADTTDISDQAGNGAEDEQPSELGGSTGADQPTSAEGTARADNLAQPPLQPGQGPPPVTWRSWLGDNLAALATLPDDSVDLVLTDPPFAVDVKNARRMSRTREAGRFIYEDKPAEVLAGEARVIAECYRVLKPDRVMFLFFGFVHYTAIFTMLRNAGFWVDHCPCFWHKGGQVPLLPDRYLGLNYESFFHCSKGVRTLTESHTKVFGPYGTPGATVRLHPTERPQVLLTEMIALATDPGEIVLDPYAGSFSTVLAAITTGRQGWGCEREPLYYGDAVARLAATAIEGTEVVPSTPLTPDAEEPPAC